MCSLISMFYDFFMASGSGIKSCHYRNDVGSVFAKELNINIFSYH